jgi:hypothetical protein
VDTTRAYVSVVGWDFLGRRLSGRVGGLAADKSVFLETSIRERARKDTPGMNPLR